MGKGLYRGELTMTDRYYTVDATFFSFDSKEEAKKFQDWLTDILCEFRVMRGIGMSTEVVEQAY